MSGRCATLVAMVVSGARSRAAYTDVTGLSPGRAVLRLSASAGCRAPGVKDASGMFVRISLRV
ncbi:hypothetical protein GQ57_13095 [Burkholderia sp. MSh2]|nr:hypothetical protein GQ57_13095 [Burkholderia sp. MSh2]